jgi:CheY-specific phosphatase CheX
MPEPAILPALDIAVKEVLERMFFVETEDAVDPRAAAVADAVAVRLAFEGEPSGWLRLQVAPELARSLAADFLGMQEGEVSVSQVESVVCELANMICGSLLSRVESETTFRLCPPSSQPAGLSEDEAGGAITRTLDAAGGLLTVILKTESPACPAAQKSAS